MDNDGGVGDILEWLGKYKRVLHLVVKIINISYFFLSTFSLFNVDNIKS